MSESMFTDAEWGHIAKALRGAADAADRRDEDGFAKFILRDFRTACARVALRMIEEEAAEAP